LLKLLLPKTGVLSDLFDALFDEIRATCRRLPCCWFLPMVQRKGLIKMVYWEKMSKKSFYDALTEGKKLLRESGCGILVYTYEKDGRDVHHCVEMQFHKNSRLEDIQFFDHQSQKNLTLESFLEISLVKIQVMQITENIKNLRQDSGTYLCSEEGAMKEVKPPVMHRISKHLQIIEDALKLYDGKSNGSKNVYNKININQHTVCVQPVHNVHCDHYYKRNSNRQHNKSNF
jgi:hypothetical protein